MKELTCNNCQHNWQYKGSSQYYATCPSCLYKVRINPKEVSDSMNKYDIKLNSSTGIHTITEYGHFMFIEDVLQRLKRLEFLEKQLQKEKEMVSDDE